MTLIKSISGIRGTVGGVPEQNLTPLDTVKFTSAFVQFNQQRLHKKHLKMVIGRDARISGTMINQLVCATLQSMGVDVIDLGLSTTPTVEMAVVFLEVDAGIILTASHNPEQWNALKLLNEKGEFISAKEGAELLELAETVAFHYADVHTLGSYQTYDNAIKDHIDAILKLDLVDTVAIKNAQFKIVIDTVNSTGGIALPQLLNTLGVKEVKALYDEPTGYFPHNPEPLPEHLTEISNVLKKGNYDLGFVVDPDVDRLAILTETGGMFGEEYTLVSIADYVISQTPGNAVSNLSSTRALSDICKKHGVEYEASAVGEVNVVEVMKKTNAVIGGEGNGGVIYPELHYGRDALVGIALFLTLLAKSKKSCSELRASYPNYVISKNRINLEPEMDIQAILNAIAEKYKDENISRIDGVKIDFNDGWVHLRASNTEPIIRIYSENTNEVLAENMAKKIIEDIREYLRK